MDDVVVLRDQLTEIDQHVVRLFSMVSGGLRAATAAFLEGDRGLAKTVVAEDTLIDELQASTEELVQEALEGRVLRTEQEIRQLVAVLRIVPELERSGDLVEHIALRAAQGLAQQLTPLARRLVEQMGALGDELWRAAADAYVNRDPDAGPRLRMLDDELDDLHVRLSAELAASATTMAVAIEMGLVGRFYERLGDHAVNVAKRVGYLLPSTPLVAGG